MVSRRSLRRSQPALLTASMILAVFLNLAPLSSWLPVPSPDSVAHAQRSKPDGTAPPLPIPAQETAPDLDNIIEETGKELIRRPNDAPLRFRLAYALEQRGDIDRAMEEYRAVIELSPTHVWARNNLGVLYQRGQYDEAIGKFGEALFRDPQHETARLNSGLVFLKIGDTDAALRQFRLLLTLNPRHVEGLIGLGRVYYEQGAVDQSLVQFREALSVDPQSATAHRFLGKALMKKGQFPEAVSAYRSAVEIRPRDAQLRYELAQVLDAQGKRPDAINELRRLLAQPQGSDGQAVRRLAETTLQRWGDAR
jgi:tetratricopeptide (TPR) repeat protein